MSITRIEPDIRLPNLIECLYNTFSINLAMKSSYIFYSDV